LNTRFLRVTWHRVTWREISARPWAAAALEQERERGDEAGDAAAAANAKAAAAEAAAVAMTSQGFSRSSSEEVLALRMHIAELEASLNSLSSTVVAGGAGGGGMVFSGRAWQIMPAMPSSSF